MKTKGKHRAACQLCPSVLYGVRRIPPPAYTRGSQLLPGGMQSRAPGPLLPLKTTPNLRMDLSLFWDPCKQAKLGNEPGQKFLSFHRFVVLLACEDCILSVPSQGRFPSCLMEFGFPHPILSRRAWSMGGAKPHFANLADQNKTQASHTHTRNALSLPGAWEVAEDPFTVCQLPSLP